MVSFLLGAGLSTLAGHFNNYTSTHIFPGDETPQFFLAVGVGEELIKFLASALGLFLVCRQNWKRDLQNNWLAHAIAGSLGFAAAENFVYGISGQGGIARVIPLVAHAFFAVFWGLGAYTASLETKWTKVVKWLSIGLLEGIILHGLYDCVVSDNLIPDKYKILSWIVMSFVIVGIVSLHKKVIDELENKDEKNLLGNFEAEPLSENLNENPESEADTKSKKIALSVLSFFMPGLGHLLKGEIFTSLSFFLLSILGPVLVLRFAVVEMSLKFSLASFSEQKFTEDFLKIALLCAFLYFVIGFWAAWENFQSNEDFIDKRDKKKRLSAYFPVSTLFFVSLFMSFFLPAFERQKGKSKEDAKKVVIKEIPLGITWEVEKVPPAPQKEENKDSGSKEQINSITLQKDPDKKPNKKDQKKQPDPAKDKPPLGVPNSDNNNLDNLPVKLPNTGYIGVQLAEIIFNGQPRAFVTFVYPNTSADRAGLKAGDFIIAVNGKRTNGLNAFQVSNMVRGPVGTPVDLILYREGKGEITTKAYRTGTTFSLEVGNNNQVSPQLREKSKNDWPSPVEIEKYLHDLEKVSPGEVGKEIKL